MITDSKAVAFRTIVNSFTNGGIEVMNVWGRIIFHQRAYPDIPNDFAASNCPTGTEANPPRKISITNAALFKVIANIPAVNGPKFNPKTGKT